MGDVIDNVSAIEGVVLTPLQIIEVEGGDVLHGIKNTDSGYSGFGEAYFSSVTPGSIKAWKRHHEMTLNLVVPIGEIRFVLYDDRMQAGKYLEVTLSRKNYHRLTVPPMLWMGFQGRDESTSMLLNIADIPHRPEEVDRKELTEIEYNWSL